MVRGPEVVVIGAARCGTGAVRAYLDAHPDLSMTPGEGLNFFVGPEEPPPVPHQAWWRTGRWHRGFEWYAAQLDPAAPVRGESSPAYSDPSHPEVPGRMASLVPWARLIYLVRDPVARAVLQWRDDGRDGTEDRDVAQALLDPDSQYVARSRFHERLAPFLPHFGDQVLVVAVERLRDDPRGELRRIYEHVGVDPSFWHPSLQLPTYERSGPEAVLPRRTHLAFLARVADDQERLSELCVPPAVLRRL